jgi:hypothetical protein
LPLAIALAGAAFEAYLEPTGAEGFQEHSLNGTDITYTDRQEQETPICTLMLLQNAFALQHAPVQ